MPDIVVIGSSMGGVEALTRLASQLPADLPAAAFVVQHTLPTGQFLLPRIIDRAGPLTAAAAEDGEPIRHGRIYVAPPDQHLIVERDHVRLSHGARENGTRPAIDPLFRSAAITYGPRVVGVVLTGMLDDGASGLSAVKRCGGVAVVQDPADAAYPEMPQSAVELTKPDYSLPLSEMGALLDRLSRMPAGEPVPVPKDIQLEVRMAVNGLSELGTKEEVGRLVPISCPECGGSLWEMTGDNLPRYRCRVGHSYTAKILLNEQGARIEQALWAAVRAMEERTNLLSKLAKDSQRTGLTRSAELYEERAREVLEHARVLRELLMGQQGE